MRKPMLLILPLSLGLLGGCAAPMVDTGPIGGGLAVIGLGLVLAAWIIALFK